MVPSTLQFKGWEEVAWQCLREAGLTFDPLPRYGSFERRLESVVQFKGRNYGETVKTLMKALYEHHPDRGGPL